MNERYRDGMYAEQNPEWHDEDRFWKSAQIFRMMDVEGVAPASIVDIGCGTGGITELVAQAVPDAAVVGYDLSPIAVGAAQLKHPTADVRIGAVQEIDDHYDLALVIDVLEHVEDCIGFLRDVSNIAKQVIIHVPLDMNAQMVLRGRPIRMVREKVGHLHYFSQYTALETIRDAGFTINAYTYTASSMYSPNPSWLTRFARIPRRLAYRLNADVSVRILGGYSLMMLASSPLTEARDAR